MKTIGLPIIMGLPDLCADLFSFCLQLQRSKDPGDAESLRLKIDDLFRTLENRAKQLEISDENFHLAKYAICAYVDEMILASDWAAVKDVWSGRPLQMEYFNDFAAGEEFFHKLDPLRQSQDLKKIDVLEVYYTCLSLGFKGMHADLQGIEKLKTLMETVSRDIRRARSKTDNNALSTNWQPPDTMPQAVKNFPAWVVVIVAGGLLLLIFILLAILLTGTVDDVRKALG